MFSVTTQGCGKTEMPQPLQVNEIGLAPAACTISTPHRRFDEACRAHASQNVADFTAAYASALGALIGRPYAEGLYLRQALEVPSVSGLFGSAKQV